MKLDLKTLGYIKVFEKHTGATVKDCFIQEEILNFIVKTGNIGRAIGKRGINIKMLGGKFKKPIRVIEFNDDVVKFVKNLIYPTNVNVEKRGSKVVIVTEDTKTKGFLFGRDKSKLKLMQEILDRYFKVELAIE